MYKIPNAVCTELTRGCVARCTYCEEVWYWKFRDRAGHRVVEEMMQQYKKHGTQFVFFADSLMNGNIKGFKDFLEANNVDVTVKNNKFNIAELEQSTVFIYCN